MKIINNQTKENIGGKQTNKQYKQNKQQKRFAIVNGQKFLSTSVLRLISYLQWPRKLK